MILYFSGTGNSKYCAEKIALKTGSELCSINNMMKKHITEIDVKGSPLLGFVCPTYDFDMAYAVAEFLDDLVIKNISGSCYVFAVFTCGKSCGTAEETMKSIKSRKRMTITTKQMPTPMKYLIKKVAVPGQRKATKNFRVNESCIGCGLCEEICPKNLIHLQEGRPVWIKDDCACCLGCIHRCPKQAIQYGKKTEKTAFSHPSLKPRSQKPPPFATPVSEASSFCGSLYRSGDSSREIKNFLYFR